MIGTTSAHTLTRQGWCGGFYTIDATIGAHNGKIEVTVYTNSSMTTPISQTGGVPPTYTITYLLDGNGKKTFTVPQAIKTVPVYVRVKWFKPNGSGGYTLDTGWGDGTGINYKTTNSTTLSGCVALAIKTLEIVDAKKDGNNTIVIFRGESTTDNEIVTLNFTLPDGTIKHISILFWAKLEPTDLWEVKVNNITNAVITVKKI